MKRSLRFSSPTLIFLFVVSDFLVPFLVFAALLLTMGFSGWSLPSLLFGLSSGVAVVFGMTLVRAYSRFVERTLARKLELIFTVWGYVVFGLLFIAFVTQKQHALPPVLILLWLAITPVALVFGRFTIQAVYSRFVSFPIKVLFLSQYEFTSFEVKRLTAKNYEWRFVNDYNVVEIMLAEYKPDYVVLPESNNGSKESSESVQNFIKKIRSTTDNGGPQVVLFDTFMEQLLRKCFVNYSTMRLLYIEQLKPYSRSAFLLKRIIDIITAISLLLVTWPIMLYAAWRIKKESPGPLIYSQLRVGRAGQQFLVYKFRSMDVNAESQGAQFAEADDPRAYPFGAFMRKTRIDELPQLFNVMRGDIHIIGPRPERKVFVDDLEKTIPFYQERHLVAPGISGWAQVMYPYGSNVEDARQKLMYDLYYIKNWSIWLEIETLLRTVVVVLGKKGI